MSTARAVEMSLFPDHAPDKPVGPILPSVFTGTNADLMLAVAPYYLTGSVLDVTYGEGKWWDRFRPEPFTFHDLHKVDGVDFRALPEADSSVDTVCFDPPYVLTGGVATKSRAADHKAAFGLVAGESLDGLDALFREGMSECARVARSWVLVKCMDATTSSRLWFGHLRMVAHAEAVGLGEPWDLIVHHTGSGPGGHNIFTPKRARRHHSYLLVFAKEPTPRARIAAAHNAGTRHPATPAPPPAGAATNAEMETT